MSYRYSFLAALVIAMLWLGAAQAGEKYSTVRISTDNKSDIDVIRSFGFENVVLGEGYAEVIVSADEMERLQTAGLKYSVTIADMAAFYRSRLEPGRAQGGYRTLSELGLVLDSISSTHPLIMTSKTSIGSTIEGRPIWVVKISDNPTVDEDEPEIYYVAAHHCREVITPELLIYFMKYLVNNYGTDPQVTYLVDNREMFFNVLANPDGYYYNETTEPGGGGQWRKNRRNNGDGSYGIDLNRNYGYMWGYDNSGSSPTPSSDTYRGTAAFSEPETQAQRLFIDSRHFKVIVDYHSYSNYFLYPWGYQEVLCPDNDIFAQMGDTVHAMNNYLPGPPWQILYTVNGGSFDWEYGNQIEKPKIYAVSLEVGSSSDGFWPAVSRITPLVQENLQPNLFYARVAGNPEALRAPAQPLIYAISDVTTDTFRLAWHHFDLANPATAFEVWQLHNLSRITDNFEGGGPLWTLDGFTLSTAMAHSGSSAYFSGYAASSDRFLKAVEPVSYQPNDTLKFWTRYNIEPGWDYGYVEISVNGGTSWSPVAGNITTTTSPHSLNLGNGITGNSGGWIEAKFPLTLLDGQDYLMRFRYKTDTSVDSGGWRIDDVYPVEYYGDVTMLSNSTTDTTLLVQNLVSGDFYYKVRAKDAQNQYSGFSPLAMAHVTIDTACTWLIADANFSGGIDISDAVYLIGFIFGGGPAPVPNAIGSGDADCSGAVDISDAVYLISFIFGGGPVPGTTCNCNNY
jgi:hypothetical protein